MNEEPHVQQVGGVILIHRQVQELAGAHGVKELLEVPVEGTGVEPTGTGHFMDQLTK